MNLFIVDNGSDYSDHVIHFVETPLPLERVERLAHLFNLDDDGESRFFSRGLYRVVAVAEGLRKLGTEPLATTSVHGLIDRCFYAYGAPQEAEVKAIDAEERALLEAM